MTRMLPMTVTPMQPDMSTTHPICSSIDIGSSSLSNPEVLLPVTLLGSLSRSSALLRDVIATLTTDDYSRYSITPASCKHACDQSVRIMNITTHVHRDDEIPLRNLVYVNRC